MEVNKKNLINNIIEKNRYYGKNNPSIKLSIAITGANLSLNNLIYLDDLSRIISLNNEIDTTYLTYKDINTVKKEFEPIRIHFNKYLNINKLVDNLEPTLNILRYSTSCNIINNNLYIEDIKLVDEFGNYTDDLRKISYYKLLSKHYDKILIVDDNFSKYSKIFQLLNIKNITDIQLLSNKNVNLEKSIDKTRLDAISSNIDLSELEKLYNDLNRQLRGKKIQSLDNYNELNNNIEYNILNLLNKYNSIILTVSNNLIIETLVDYINELLVIAKEYVVILNNQDNLTKENINLLESIRIILNNSLDLLGVIPIYL